jgi:hypothetical protein
MQCRNCGTEIADKAIVCYRCGHPTADPVRKAAVIRPKRSPLVSLLVAAVLALVAVWFAYAPPQEGDPAQWRTLAGVLAGAAAIVVVLGLLRRRR